MDEATDQDSLLDSGNTDLVPKQKSWFRNLSELETNFTNTEGANKKVLEIGNKESSQEKVLSLALFQEKKLCLFQHFDIILFRNPVLLTLDTKMSMSWAIVFFVWAAKIKLLLRENENFVFASKTLGIVFVLQL